MAVKGKSAQRPPVRVFLDGKSLDLPNQCLVSLQAVRAHLELAAWRQDRILLGLKVDGKQVNLRQEICPESKFRQVRGQSISLQEMGCGLADTARDRTRKLQHRVEALVSLVLINPWPMAFRLLQEVQVQLQGLVILIGFLHELCFTGLLQAQPEHQSMAPLVDRLVNIRNRLSRFRDRGDNLELSDELERNLAPWLHDLGAYLERFGHVK